MKEDFREFIAADQVEVLDILHVPDLTPYELNRKLIFVVKKEDDNLRHLLSIFQDQYPVLRNKSVLIIDDEADLASVSFRKTNGVSSAGVISQQIDRLREFVTVQPICRLLQLPMLFTFSLMRRLSSTVVLSSRQSARRLPFCFQHTASMPGVMSILRRARTLIPLRSISTVRFRWPNGTPSKKKIAADYKSIGY